MSRTALDGAHSQHHDSLTNANFSTEPVKTDSNVRFATFSLHAEAPQITICTIAVKSDRKIDII